MKEGRQSVGVMAPSAETFLMDEERCPRVLFNSIKQSRESSIHQESFLFPGAAQENLAGLRVGLWLAVCVLWLVPWRGAVSNKVSSHSQQLRRDLAWPLMHTECK